MQSTPKSENFSKNIDEGRSDDTHQRSHQTADSGSLSRNNHTPHGGFMLLRRNLTSRGSSTPNRNTCYCPFSTPDRLNESFVAHEVFETQLIAIQERNSFSPCIEWQATMNPAVFDTSNPAAYLPPVRSQSAEQRYDKAINAYFRRKILPSPTPSSSNRRRSAYSSIDKHNSTMDTEPPVTHTSCAKETSTSCQTEITIPPNYDTDRLFAPFATFTDNESLLWLMDMSRSSSSSSTSASSLSRRKLFSEDDLDDHAQNENCSTSVVIHSYHSFDETVALSSPPKHNKSGSCLNQNVSPREGRTSIDGPVSHITDRFADIGEIPKGDLDIDLSPIKPYSSTVYEVDDEDIVANSSLNEFREHRTMEDTASAINMSIV